MARPLRIEYAGALYHVTARGDRREDIYLVDEDRRAWLQILAQGCSRFNWRCHAWCQMDNHYHILIETAERNLSQGMRQLNCLIARPDLVFSFFGADRTEYNFHIIECASRGLVQQTFIRHAELRTAYKC